MTQADFDKYFIPLASVFFSSTAIVQEKSKGYYASLKDFKASTWAKVSLEATDEDRMLKPIELKDKCRAVECGKEKLVEYAPESVAYSQPSLSAMKECMAIVDLYDKGNIDSAMQRIMRIVKERVSLGKWVPKQLFDKLRNET